MYPIYETDFNQLKELVPKLKISQAMIFTKSSKMSSRQKLQVY